MTKSFALTLIGLGFGAGIAAAQPPVTVYGSTAPSARVSYADINLTSAEGIATLKGRVRSAASDICLEPVREDIDLNMARKMCYRTAIRDGFSQVDRLVSDRLAGKTSLTTAILISAR
ncbi:MAG: UrcA family protein [Sphingomonas sp.]|nr:UrcA family protein [Sphingomonas sp.]